MYGAWTGFFFLVLVLAAVALGLRTAGARAVQKLASPQHCYNSTIKNMSQFTFFFILASTKLTAINIYLKDNFSSGSPGSATQQKIQTNVWRIQIISNLSTLFTYCRGNWFLKQICHVFETFLLLVYVDSQFSLLRCQSSKICSLILHSSHFVCV